MCAHRKVLPIGRKFVSFGILSLLLIGCGRAGLRGVQPSVSTGTPSTGGRIVEYSTIYTSLAQIRSASVAVVVATAGSSIEGHYGEGSTFTRSNMTLNKLLWGEFPGSTFTAETAGGSDLNIVNGIDPLKEGSTYLLFLFHENGEDGKPTPYYGITGGQGAFLLQGNNYVNMMKRDSGLPSTLDRATTDKAMSTS